MDDGEVYKLTPAAVPAQLLKLSQVELVPVGEHPRNRRFMRLPESSFEETASPKHGLSLRHYLKRFTYIRDGKSYNIAALYAKYKYAAMLG